MTATRRPHCQQAAQETAKMLILPTQSLPLRPQSKEAQALHPHRLLTPTLPPPRQAKRAEQLPASCRLPQAPREADPPPLKPGPPYRHRATPTWVWRASAGLRVGTRTREMGLDLARSTPWGRRRPLVQRQLRRRQRRQRRQRRRLIHLSQRWGRQRKSLPPFRGRHREREREREEED